MKTIDILGTKYKLIMKVDPKDKDMESVYGACFYARKEIKIIDVSKLENWANESKEAIEWQEKKTLRHEIIHAFLNESGIMHNSLNFSDGWTQNEEMIDWFAIQSPKIFALYKKLDLI